MVIFALCRMCTVLYFLYSTECWIHIDYKAQCVCLIIKYRSLPEQMRVYPLDAINITQQT